jgi:ATP-binding cassette subfamily C (CFTR/MRP) protein 1
MEALFHKLTSTAVSLLGSLGATGLIMTRQALWLEGIERRIAATNAMLNSMKGVKMGGLTEVLRDDLQQLRIDELNISKKFRKLLIWTMGFCELFSVNAGISVLITISLYIPDSITHPSLRCVFRCCPKRK